MPHEESWFSLLPFHARFLAFARNFGKPFSDDGHTWYAHQTPGVQHIYAALFVLGLIVIVSVVTDTSIRDGKGELVPTNKLTIRNFVEILVGVCYRMMSDIMGEKPARYFLPLIGSCAVFIFFFEAPRLGTPVLSPPSTL